MTDLDLYGDDEHPAAYDEPATPILPDSESWGSRANWHLRNIARLEDDSHRIERHYDAEIRRLEDRRDLALGTLAERIDWHRQPLEQLHLRLLEADPKRKTITLACGELRSRTPRTPSMSLDRDQFTAWAEVNAPDLVEHKPYVSRDRVKDALDAGRFHAVDEAAPGETVLVVTDDGEVVPGLTLRLGAPTITVETEPGAWT